MTVRLDEIQQTKYPNYFEGLIVTDAHLNSALRYHQAKRELQNRLFNGYGVVPGVMNELRVSAHKGSDSMSLEVGSGMCIDASGREITLPESKIVSVDIQKYKLPRTIYVVLSYNENQEDHFVNEANPTYQGYQSIRESCQLEILGHEPEVEKYVELARVHLAQPEGKERLAISDAKVFGDPQTCQIDLRFVPWCQVAPVALSPELASQLSFVLERTRDGAALLEEEMRIQALREIQIVASTSLIVLSGAAMNFHSLVHLLKPLIRLDQKIVQEVQEMEKNATKKHFTKMEKFEEYKKGVAELVLAVERYNQSTEELHHLLNGHMRAMGLLKQMMSINKLTWEDIKLLSQELPKILLVGDTKYTLVDTLEMGSKENLEAHMFETKGVRDQLLAKQNYIYPDTKTVLDVVMSYRKGNLSWKVRNCIPNKPLIMIRRFDYFYGGLDFEIQVNGKSAGNLVIEGRDTRNRWRNWAFQINPDLVTSDTVDITQRWIKGQQDAIGRIWFYQPTV